MSDKATIIRRLEAAYAHALDELMIAEEQYDLVGGDSGEVSHLRGHVAGLKQALNLCKEQM